MSEGSVFTYQTRLLSSKELDTALDAYAELYGRAERSLFAAKQKPDFDGNAAKREFQKQFELNARQYNAIRAGLDGKIASISERRPELIREQDQRIARATKAIERMQVKLQDLLDPEAAFKARRVVKTLTAEQRQKLIQNLGETLHQKMRRLSTLKDRLATIKADEAAGTTRLCFGSRKLFRAQFDLQANGFETLQDWRREWHAARASQFYVLGSKDETAGNQCCQASIDTNGNLSLKLRLPGALATHGKYLTIPGVHIAYGGEQISAALMSSCRVTVKDADEKETVKRTGTALSYRFLKDDKGWRVFVSLTEKPKAQITQRMLGAFGVDINADHLAVSETDRFGNWVDSVRFDIAAYGASADQCKAWIGDAAKELAAKAAAAGKPVVIELLDFRVKKAALEGSNPRQARMLSSFACNKTIQSIKAACFRAGVEVIEINPAYTSTIGAVNHAQRLGISVHQGAALAIARRGLGLTEKPIKACKKSEFELKPSKRTTKVASPQGLVTAPTGDGGHVTLQLSERNRSRHVWSQWAKVRTALKAAHVAHRRSGNSKGFPAPLSPMRQASCAHRHSTAGLRGANRSHHCSVSVIDNHPDVPI
jgi:IS605 OrfB family transposase